MTATQKQLEQSECNQGQFAIHAFAGAVANFAGGWLGTVPPAILQSIQYRQNLACQYLYPSVADANMMLIRNQINREEWRAIVAANGYCIPFQEVVVDANWTVPSPLEAVVLYNRDVIRDSEFNELMYRNGVKDTRGIELYKELARFIPGPSDQVRFMVRDVFDRAAVERLKLDTDFAKKFDESEQAKDLAKAAGMDRDTFLNFWRSHWDIPSNTQLYDALHRIREDKNFGGVTAKAVTMEEIIETLKLNDMSPAWVERLAYLSFAPYTRVDTRRMYEVGVLNREQVKGSYLDQGYDDEHAENLAEFTTRVSAQNRAKFNGQPTAAQIVKMYQDGGFREADALNMLETSGLTREQARNTLDIADLTRDAKYRAANVKALRRRFLQGAYDVGQASTKLQQFGIAPERTTEILAQWQEELDLKYKQPTVAALCKWNARGYINGETFRQRIRNLGYTDEDAANFVGTCNAESQERQAKATEAAIRKAIADSKAERREAEKRAKELAPCKPAPKPVCGADTNQSSE